MQKWLVPVIILSVLLLLIPACSSSTTSPSAAITTSQPPITTTSQPPVSTTSQPPTSTTNPPTTSTAGLFPWETPGGPTPQRGGILKIITGSPVNIGVPWEGIVPPDLWYTNPVVETLLRTDLQGNPIPWLATGWTIAPDYKSITFTLRQGVKFQDGTDFNAQSVKYDLEKYAQSPNPELKNVTSVDVVDPYTVKINMSSYQPAIFSFLAVGKPGWMVSPTAAQTMTSDEMRLHPVGTGPFKFESYTPDVSMKFTRFDDYWQKGKPYLDGVEYDIITDSVTAVVAFKAGTAQVNYNLSPSDAYNLQQAGYHINACQASIYQFIPDSADPNSPWSNVDVRRAGQYAIDTVALAKAEGFGWADPYWNQVFPKGNPAYNPDIVGYPYNPAKAKELLAQAGYPNGFKTNLYVTVPPVGDLETAVQNYLGQVGIQAEIKPLPGGSYFQASQQGWQNGLYRSQSVASLGADPGYQMNSYLSVPAQTWVSCARPQDMEDLLTAATTEPDQTKRYQLYQELCKNIIDTHALIISTWGGYLLASDNGKVNDANIRNIWTMTWTPEDAWLSK